MSAVLVAAALVVATGATAALAATDPRLGLVGLAAALVGAALLADPLPTPTVLAVRLSGALLAAAVLRAFDPGVTPGRAQPPEPDGEARSRVGWPAEALLAIAGGLAGLIVATGLASFAPDGAGGASGAAPFDAAIFLSAGTIAMALAGALAAISVPALLAGRGLRRAAAAVLATQAAVLLRFGLAGPAGVLEEVVLAALLVAVAAAAALIAGAGRGRAEIARPT